MAKMENPEKFNNQLRKFIKTLIKNTYGITYKGINTGASGSRSGALSFNIYADAPKAS